MEPALPRTPDELGARVRSRVSEMSPAEARVARLVAENPGSASASTVAQLSRRAGVSDATVIRAARSLGFTGYAQMRLVLAGIAALPSPEPEGSLTADIAVGDATGMVVAELAASEQQAIRETAASLDAATLDVCAHAIADSHRLVIFGVGASGLVGQDLHQKLTRAGRWSFCSPEPEATLTMASLLGPGDVAVLISEHGRTPDVSSVLDQARSAGATTVAITGSEGSPLARRADHVLIATSHDIQFRPGALASRISQLVVVDCLFICVLQATWPHSSDAIGRTRDAVKQYRGQ